MELKISHYLSYFSNTSKCTSIIIRGLLYMFFSWMIRIFYGAHLNIND